MTLALVTCTCSIANGLQHQPPVLFRYAASRGLALLCCLLVVLAGTLAGNAAWHEAWHHHPDGVGQTTCQHGDTDSAGHTSDDEATCAICAFAHQQVTGGWVSPLRAPVPVRCVVAERMVPSAVLCELVWPEPSGRGPPIGA